MRLDQPVSSDTPAPPDARELLLQAQGLSAGYGGVPIVRGLDLEVRAGEVVALVGANGAGKSTTLLSVAGVLPPLSGTVMCLGETRHVPLHHLVRRGLGFVPESRTIISSLTTEENLRLGRGDIGAAVELMPELGPLLKRRGGLLSGGEQQILALARVLAAHPRLVLADEMSLGLAPLVVRRLLDAVRTAADRGLGVLIVEQQVRNVLTIADRVVVLRRGEVVIEGSASDLRDRLDEIEASYFTSVH